MFYATDTTEMSGFSASDGPSTNLPLVVLLVEKLNGDRIVFDGLFLTAQRPPRKTEVIKVLDAAIAVGNASFSPQRVAFTSSTQPAQAVQYLLSVKPLQQLDTTSKNQYLALL